MYDPVRICEILNEEGVRYIVVGGFAAVIHGSSLTIKDIDLVPDRSGDNLERDQLRSSTEAPVESEASITRTSCGAPPTVRAAKTSKATSVAVVPGA